MVNEIQFAFHSQLLKDFKIAVSKVRWQNSVDNVTNREKL